MEIKVLSNSTSSLLVRYFWTRFPAWLVLLLPLVVVLPGVLVGRFSSATEFWIALGIALLVVVEFRLWDDLCDREQDCREDPSRVLCQAKTTGPFIAVVLVLGCLNLSLMLWACGPPAALVFLLLHMALGVWYGLRGYLGSFLLSLGLDARPSIINYHVVLLKYPKFAFLLGMSPQEPFAPALLLWIAVVYLGLCIFEVLHDPRLRMKRSAWICLTVESILLVVIATILVMRKVL